MNNPDPLLTIIIGQRSNLSYHLVEKLDNAEVFSSESLLDSLLDLRKFREKKVNVVFNNFQPSTQLNSFLNPVKYIDLSISLTLKVLMYLIENGALINQIIYTSSCSVYGDLINNSDHNKTAPKSIPSSLKYLNEQILMEVCSNFELKLTVARLFNIFGGDDNFSVVSKIYNCYINNTKLNIFNGGKSERDFVHVKDVADVYKKILLEPIINFDTIDIGCGEGKSVADILNYLSINGFNILTENANRDEIDSSKANVIKINTITSTSSFIDVNRYLLNRLDSLAIITKKH